MNIIWKGSPNKSGSSYRKPITHVVLSDISTSLKISNRISSQPWFVNRIVLGVAQKQLEVFYSVVGMVPVYVVNNLSWFKMSPKIFFHYKSMFKNISSSICKRMFVRFNINISPFVNSFSTFPIDRFRPSSVKGSFIRGISRHMSRAAFPTPFNVPSGNNSITVNTFRGFFSTLLSNNPISTRPTKQRLNPHFGIKFFPTSFTILQHINLTPVYHRGGIYASN